jgi:hypothetical protein
MNPLSTSTNAIPEKWIDALFAKLHSFYGTRFLDMWRGNDLQTVKAVWTQELSKLSRDEVAKGANSLVNQEYCPTLPQFINLCRIKIDSVAAYYEAVNGVVARDKGEMGEWSHPAIFWASVKVGAFDLKNQTYSNIKARWERALDEEINKGQWSNIPKAQIALPAPVTQATKDIAEKYLAETQIIKKQESKTDHKRWAKVILQREKDGDKTLTHIQLSMAKDAMKNEVY